MGPIQTRVFRRIVSQGQLGAAIDDVTAEVNAFLETVPVADMINVEYLIGQVEKYGSDTYYVAIVTYLES